MFILLCLRFWTFVAVVFMPMKHVTAVLMVSHWGGLGGGCLSSEVYGDNVEKFTFRNKGFFEGVVLEDIYSGLWLSLIHI